MERSNLLVSKVIESKNDIHGLCIVKLHGAAGGRGYFIAWNRESFERQAIKLKEQKLIKGEQDLFIQGYGLVFLHSCIFFIPL